LCPRTIWSASCGSGRAQGSTHPTPVDGDGASLGDGDALGLEDTGSLGDGDGDAVGEGEGLTDGEGLDEADGSGDAESVTADPDSTNNRATTCRGYRPQPASSIIAHRSHLLART
jgi:hypothetical protein